jgi:hypothetical protein
VEGGLARGQDDGVPFTPPDPMCILSIHDHLGKADHQS